MVGGRGGASPSRAGWSVGERGANGLAFYIYFVQDGYKIKRSGAVLVDQYIYIYIYICKSKEKILNN